MTRPPRAERIIIGRIATLAGERGFGWQRGVAIADGRVIATGSEPELESLATPATTWWHLREGEAAMPAITDAHLHLMLLLLGEGQLDLTGLDLAGVLAAVARQHAALLARHDQAGWLMGHGWSAHELGGWPSADDLERVAPGRPVALRAHDFHSLWASPAALRLGAVDGPRGVALGELVRRGHDGRATGILLETSAALVEEVIPEPTGSELITRVDAVAAHLARLGLTGCHDPGELGAEIEIRRGPLFYRDLAAAGRLPLRVHASIRAPQLERAIELGLHSGDSLGRYTMGWLKLFSDGSLGSRNAALLAPYEDASDTRPTGGPTGMMVTDADELGELLGRAASAGIVGQVHAIGDAAVRLALDAMSATTPAGGPLQPRIEHAQLVDPVDQLRFGPLGIVASVQPVHLRSDARQELVAWGTRAQQTFPLRSMLDSGAMLAFGTDAPVEPVDPWPGIAVALARRDPFDPAAPVIGAGQAINLAEAIRGACLGPAQSAGRTDLGRLTSGSVADLLVVPGTALDDGTDPAVLAATRPLATFMDGQPVYLSDGFDPAA